MNTLSDGLDQQTAAMETLRACLEEEHLALQTRDPEQLLTVAERKKTCLANAAQISLRYQELETMAAANSPATSDQALDQRREQLDTLTRLCRDLNNVNGSLINRQWNRVDKTLQIMCGGTERSSVYDPSGNKPRQNSARRILASI